MTTVRLKPDTTYCRWGPIGMDNDASKLGDMVLRTIGIDVDAAGGLERAAVALRERGYSRLAERYATRAAPGGSDRR